MTKPKSEKYTKEQLDAMQEKQDLAGHQGLIDDRGVHTKLKTIEEVRKAFLELRGEYNSLLKACKSEHLTLLQDEPCQYCNLAKRELKIVQSELNDAYAMLQNRDNKIKDLERELKCYEAKGE